jgi:ankyrin repeat protein
MNNPITNIDKVFLYACKNGHLHVAQWLLQIKPAIDISAYNEEAFRGACSNGHLHVAQWLLQIKPTIYISAQNEYAFRWACVNEHLNIAQWLFQIKPTINISAYNESAFRYACYNGDLNVAQWFVSLRPDKYKIKLNANGSISYEIIKPLNIVGIKQVSELEQCPICCVSVCDVITCCNHSYCTQCISNWLNTNHSLCPTCRTEIGNKAFRKLVVM